MIFEKKYDVKYTNIKVDGESYRMYDERIYSANDIFWCETKIKWEEFINNYDFNIYIIKTTPKTTLKLKSFFKSNVDFEKESLELANSYWKKTPHYKDQTFEDFFFKMYNRKYETIEEQLANGRLTQKDFEKIYENLDFRDLDVKNIKSLQSSDLYYLYINILYEVLYFIPKISSDGYYYFEIIVILNKNQKISDIFDYNYNLIKPIQIIPVSIDMLSIDFLRNLNLLTQIKLYDIAYDLDEYHWYKIRDNFEETKFLEDNPNLTWNQEKPYTFAIQRKTDERLEFNFYAKTIFRNICNHIFSMDCKFVKNYEDGHSYYHKTWSYGLNFETATNYFQIFGAVSVSLNDKNTPEFSSDEICISTFSMDALDLRTSIECFSKEYILNGFIDFSKIK